MDKKNQTFVLIAIGTFVAGILVGHYIIAPMFTKNADENVPRQQQPGKQPGKNGPVE